MRVKITTSAGPERVLTTNAVRPLWPLVRLPGFGEERNGTLADHARLVYEQVQRLGVPAWVLGPVQPLAGDEVIFPVLAVYPEHGAVERITSTEFNARLGALAAAHCAATERTG